MSDGRIRILQVITSLAGGAGFHAYQLTRNLDPQRFAVQLVFGPGYPLDARVAGERLPHHHVRWTRRLNPITTIQGALDLVRILRRERADIVHVHCSLAGVVGRLAARHCGVPHVLFTFHAFASRDYQPAWRKRLFLGIEQVMDRFTNHYCVYSRVFRDLIVAKGISTAKRVSLIPLGIEASDPPTTSARAHARELLGLQTGELVVAMAGRLEPQKGVVYLLRAFGNVLRRIPAARLLIIGDGPLRGTLEREASHLGIGHVIRFAGWRNDLEVLLPGIDLFCLPSLWECIPYVLLEAMAAPIAIVATRVDGVPEYVEEGSCGLLVPPADPGALSEAIVTLLGDPERRRALAATARRRVETAFRQSQMIARYEALYTRVVEAAGTPMVEGGSLG